MRCWAVGYVAAQAQPFWKSPAMTDMMIDGSFLSRSAEQAAMFNGFHEVCRIYWGTLLAILQPLSSTAVRAEASGVECNDLSYVEHLSLSSQSKLN